MEASKCLEISGGAMWHGTVAPGRGAQRILSKPVRPPSSSKHSSHAKMPTRLAAEVIGWFIKHRKFLAAGGIVLTLLLFAFFIYRHRSSKTTYYIAYIGRYQSTGLDELQFSLLTKYVDDFTAQLKNIRFELINFDIGKDRSYDSTNAYKAIAGNPAVVIVVDNTWGVNLAAVSRLITASKIPVISMNADMQNVDYKKQVAFIGSDDDVPEKIKVFAEKILHNDAAVVVAERSFYSTAKLIDAPPGATLLFVSNSTVNEDEKATLFKNLRQQFPSEFPAGRRRTLLLNTHSLWGNEIIDFVSSNYHDIDVLGGPYITSRKLNEIRLENSNRLIVFTDSSDAISNRVRKDVERIKLEDPKLSPLINTDLYVERCLNAIAIFENGVRSIEKKRGAVISKNAFVIALQNLAVDYFVKDNELYSFNSDLRLADNRIFEQHFNGEVSSYPWQLSEKNEVIPNIHVGLDDIQISAIDIKKGSFHADFTYWLKYERPKKDVDKGLTTDKRLEDYLVFRNLTKGELKDLLSEPVEPNGIYRLFKMSGDFEMRVDLASYPWDRQEPTIELEAIYPRDKIHVSFDHENYKGMNDEFNVHSAEWDKEETFVTVDNVIGEAFGGTAPSKDKKLQMYETLNIRTRVRRNPKYSLITIIFPLWMIGLTAVGVLYVKDSSFESIGHVCVVIFLAIVTYHITFAEFMPNDGSVTIAHGLLFGAFVMIFVVFIKVIILNSGMITRRIQSWVNERSTIIGHTALAIYCVMTAVAVILSNMWANQK